MSYLDAPATRMIATNCAACGRPLLDAKSVEIGLGPDCRKRLGFDQQVSEDARREANMLVYRIALEQTGEVAVERAERLRALGFPALADRILSRVVDIAIWRDGDRLVVKAPFREEAREAWRSIPGRRWDVNNRVSVFPCSARPAIHSVLCAFYCGALAVGPKGPFVVQQWETR